MKPEMRAVTKQFNALDAHVEPKRHTTFSAGDRIVMIENDGSHVTFVREGDVKVAEPFITTGEEIETNTGPVPSPH